MKKPIGWVAVVAGLLALESLPRGAVRLLVPMEDLGPHSTRPSIARLAVRSSRMASGRRSRFSATPTALNRTPI
jgi:hypothetical protein